MYPNNNNKNKKKTKTKREKSKRENDIFRLRESAEREINLFFLLFISLLDLRKSDYGFSSKQKAKLVYATRATRWYQKLSVSSNSKI